MSIASILADNAPVASIATPSVVERHNSLLASASTFATIIADSENKLAVTAKEWGVAFFNLVRIHGHSGDELAEQSRVAMGWKHLAGEAGAKVKTRFNTLKSRCSTVNGRWNDLSETQRNELLGGIKSINTVYDELAKADKEAAKAEKAAKAAIEQAEKTANPDVPSVTSETVAFNVGDAITGLCLSFDVMDAEQFAAISDDFNAMVAAYDARLAALLDAKPAAIAA